MPPRNATQRKSPIATADGNRQGQSTRSALDDFPEAIVKDLCGVRLETELSASEIDDSGPGTLDESPAVPRRIHLDAIRKCHVAAGVIVGVRSCEEIRPRFIPRDVGIHHPGSPDAAALQVRWPRIRGVHPAFATPFISVLACERPDLGVGEQGMAGAPVLIRVGQRQKSAVHMERHHVSFSPPRARANRVAWPTLIAPPARVMASWVLRRRELRAVRKDPAVSGESGPIVCISDPLSIDPASLSAAARDALRGIEDRAVVASAGRGIAEKTRVILIEDFPDRARRKSGNEGCGPGSHLTATKNVETRTRIRIVGDAGIRGGRRASARDSHPKPTVRNRRLEGEGETPIRGPRAGHRDGAGLANRPLLRSGIARSRQIDHQSDQADSAQEHECSTAHACPSSMCPGPGSS